MSQSPKKSLTATEISFAGLTFKSPLVAPAGTAGMVYDFARFTDSSAFGAMAFKSVTPEARAGSREPRVAECATGWINSIGLQNDGIDIFLEKHFPAANNVPVVKIVSLAASSVGEYASLTKRIAGLLDEKIIIELNLSCPNTGKHARSASGGSGTAPYFSSDPNLLHEVATACVAVRGSHPIMVKLSPHVASIAEVAVAAEEAGVQAISLINTIRGLSMDAKTGRAHIGAGIGGYSGVGIFPIALAMVYEAAQAVSVPILGLGGVSSFNDVLAMMRAGASLVGIGTASMVEPQRGPRIYRQLQKYLKQENLSVQDLIGTAKLP